MICLVFCRGMSMKIPMQKALACRFGIAACVVAFPFLCIHLVANPNDAPISFFQHFMAALANFFGPWGIFITHLVDFPNAGLRSFSLATALFLTALGVLLVWLGARTGSKRLQNILTGCWTIFLVAWFVVGFLQIADGLL